MDKQLKYDISKFCMLLTAAIFGGMLSVPHMIVPAIVGIIINFIAYVLSWRDY